MLSQVEPHYFKDSRVLSSIGDDGGIFKLPAPDKSLLVATVDFFTPLVDDPFSYGEIAAANAISDIYAMAAKPLFALNIAAFCKEMDSSTCASILNGASSKLKEAETVVIGGHTVTSKEPIFGQAIVGIASNHTLKINSPKVGDKLVLTKPLGTGILATAFKKDKIDEEEYHECVNSMKKLNRTAMEACIIVGVNAITDISGFGLIGHILRVLENCESVVKINLQHIKYFPKVMECLLAGIYPEGTNKNLSYAKRYIKVGTAVTEVNLNLLADPQTSGGLLISVNAAKVEQLLNILSKNNSEACIVGDVLQKFEPNNNCKIYIE